ncbi:energy-converting hydrogenase Eha subunit G [Lysobacter sp. HA18]
MAEDLRSQYRGVMFRAFSVPAGLFLLLLLTVVLCFGPGNAASLAGLVGTLLGLLGPLFLSGFLLAPWAGQRLPVSKGPAFAMAAAAALASAAGAAVMAGSSGLGYSLFIAGVFVFFALPASLIGALLFVGGCERLHRAGEPESSSA